MNYISELLKQNYELSLNIIIGLITGFISGLLSGFLVTKHFDKKNVKLNTLLQFHKDKEKLIGKISLLLDILNLNNNRCLKEDFIQNNESLVVSIINDIKNIKIVESYEGQLDISLYVDDIDRNITEEKEKRLLSLRETNLNLIKHEILDKEIGFYSNITALWYLKKTVDDLEIK